MFASMRSSLKSKYLDFLSLDKDTLSSPHIHKNHKKHRFFFFVFFINVGSTQKNRLNESSPTKMQVGYLNLTNMYTFVVCEYHALKAYTYISFKVVQSRQSGFCILV